MSFAQSDLRVNYISYCFIFFSFTHQGAIFKDYSFVVATRVYLSRIMNIWNRRVFREKYRQYFLPLHKIIFIVYASLAETANPTDSVQVLNKLRPCWNNTCFSFLQKSLKILQKSPRLSHASNYFICASRTASNFIRSWKGSLI